MFAQVPFGTCPSCHEAIYVPPFHSGRVVPCCALCSMKPQAILVGAREVMAQSYRGVAVPEVALALMAHAGQFVTALLNQDTLASRAFLANVIALGELLLSRTDTDVTPEG